MKTAIVYSIMLVFAVSAEIFEFDNNFIEYGPAQRVSIPYQPYPYQAIEPVAAPVYRNTFNNAIVPATSEVASVGFFSTAISCTFDAVKGALGFLLTNAPAIITGIIGALGLCKLTSLCDSQITIYEAQTELRSLATPERLSRAAKFVTDAVKKYNEMQKN